MGAHITSRGKIIIPIFFRIQFWIFFIFMIVLYRSLLVTPYFYALFHVLCLEMRNFTCKCALWVLILHPGEKLSYPYFLEFNSESFSSSWLSSTGYFWWRHIFMPYFTCYASEYPNSQKHVDRVTRSFDFILFSLTSSRAPIPPCSHHAGT